uniref:Uncharacterized protein n=1 Tax=Anguilla anguilla TaxID=7936 RepID=A0A0E9WDY5_ANGAN
MFVRITGKKAYIAGKNQSMSSYFVGIYFSSVWFISLNYVS